MMMWLHIFLLLFFMGGVFGGLNQHIYPNNAVSTPQRIFNILYNFQSKSSFGKRFHREDSENITSIDISDMDHRSKLQQLDEVLYIMFIQFMKTICIDNILETSCLLNEKYYWIQDIICYVSNTLMNNAIFD
ncbi:hypothetical protein ACFW04_003614 [Cataglyphis niger]